MNRMSDALISRKAVLEILYDISNRNYGSFFGHGINRACDVIKHADTAFDKEKAIEELKTKAEDSRKYWSEFNDEDAFGEMNAYIKAIEIVEKGGIE